MNHLHPHSDGPSTDIQPTNFQPTPLRLSDKDQALLAGEGTRAQQMAMRILVTMARVYQAGRLLDIGSAHIDGCLYHGISGLEFAQRLVEGGAKAVVPTTLNVGAYDLIHPENYCGDDEFAGRAKELMDLYKAMGCRTIWTCAPYQVNQRPTVGMQIAWAESNAIVFANSVLGARTNRYGDFIDICAAITGRAPAAGLHLTENRRGQLLFNLHHLPETLLGDDSFYPILGYLIGERSWMERGPKIPVIQGLPPETTEDQLKALGAAAASSGAVALFHAVGITPEAPTLAEALHHQPPEETIELTVADVQRAYKRLSTVPDGPIHAVALGSPHFSIDEFGQLLPLVEDSPPCKEIEFVVCTNRFVLDQLNERGWKERLDHTGIRLVVDTCVVVTPIIRAQSGTLMTNSGKFAHYTPGNIGLDVIYGSLQECVRSAAAGHVWRDDINWTV
ncbi:MAG: aconitase X catalytic domain-containing protein [Chloroflexota bacterium]